MAAENPFSSVLPLVPASGTMFRHDAQADRAEGKTLSGTDE